jgi:hypothetical protein
MKQGAYSSRLSRLIARHPLARDLTPVLIIKLILMLLAGTFLFGAAQQVYVDNKIIATHLFDQPLPLKSK